jgi:hypothetical protein
MQRAAPLRPGAPGRLQRLLRSVEDGRSQRCRRRHVTVGGVPQRGQQVRVARVVAQG